MQLKQTSSTQEFYLLKEWHSIKNITWLYFDQKPKATTINLVQTVMSCGGGGLLYILDRCWPWRTWNMTTYLRPNTKNWHPAEGKIKYLRTASTGWLYFVSVTLQVSQNQRSFVFRLASCNFSWYNLGTLSKDHTRNNANRGKSHTSFKVPITPQNIFHLMKSLYGISTNPKIVLIRLKYSAVNGARRCFHTVTSSLLLNIMQ